VRPVAAAQGGLVYARRVGEVCPRGSTGAVVSDAGVTKVVDEFGEVLDAVRESGGPAVDGFADVAELVHQLGHDAGNVSTGLVGCGALGIGGRALLGGCGGALSVRLLPTGGAAVAAGGRGVARHADE
jgi:hypothetical protein